MPAMPPLMNGRAARTAGLWRKSWASALTWAGAMMGDWEVAVAMLLDDCL